MSIFKFKQFEVNQANSAMKIGTDAMIFGALIQSADKKHALDIGTGTGVLSLMLAQNNPSIQIKAIEIEESAFTEAKNNFDNSPFKNQLEAIHCDINLFDSDEKFDLIFTNPPYFENSSKSVSDQRNLARHTDTLSLKDLALKASKLITDDGDIWIILPLDQMHLIAQHLWDLNFFTNHEILIYGKENQPVRQIFTFSRTEKTKNKQELIIRNPDNQYTESYKELTIDFHFNKL